MPSVSGKCQFGWLLGKGSLPEIIHSAIQKGMAKGMRWRVWAVLKTCQRCNNLLRESISAVNYPCDQNESPTVSLKSCLCLSNLCPLHPALFSADTESRLFPSSLQYPAMHLNHFVLFLHYFSRSSNQVVSLFPWRPRNHYLCKPQWSSSRPSSLSSHPRASFRPKRPKKKEPMTKPEVSVFLHHLATWEGNLIVTFTHLVQKNPMCYACSTAYSHNWHEKNWYKLYRSYIGNTAIHSMTSAEPGSSGWGLFEITVSIIFPRPWIQHTGPTRANFSPSLWLHAHIYRLMLIKVQIDPKTWETLL